MKKLLFIGSVVLGLFAGVVNAKNGELFEKRLWCHEVGFIKNGKTYDVKYGIDVGFAKQKNKIWVYKPGVWPQVLGTYVVTDDDNYDAYDVGSYDYLWVNWDKKEVITPYKQGYKLFKCKIDR